MNRFFLLALAAVLGGCSMFGSQSDSLSFETSASAYAPGAAVGVRLANDSDAGVSFNLCYAFLALEQGGEVVAAGLGPDEQAFCQANLVGLAPGEAAEATAYLPDDLAAGTYQLATEVEVGGDRQRVVTSPFEVR